MIAIGCAECGQHHEIERLREALGQVKSVLVETSAWGSTLRYDLVARRDAAIAAIDRALELKP